MGSPPPPGSKKAVFTLRSVSSMVIAPASTGRARSNRITVIKAAHTNKGIRSHESILGRILVTVEIKFNAPKIELTPARWREKIARSTDAPAWAKAPERGGYTVHPVPTPFSTALDAKRRQRAGGNNQKLRLLRRGKAISGAPIIKGISQFPNPPIRTGMTRKKIIRNACAVTMTL